jgi:predicted N-acyltransferase
MEVSIVERIEEVDPQQWDALTGADNPFIEHAFLAALEESGSVGADTGWEPAHLVVREGGVLVGASPLYIKRHSYGEYIFDWSWAEASQRARIPYYPKLVSAVPFTPATGRRLLTRGSEPDPEVCAALVAGMKAVAEAADAWSIHVLFNTEAERSLLATQHGLIPRTTQQFHWENEGYADFDEWLARFRSRDRKKTRRERSRAMEGIDAVYCVRGAEMTDRHWSVLRRNYQDTCAKKWGSAYLTDAFFTVAAEKLAHRSMAYFAEKDGEIVASTLMFHKGGHLYGRYWGGKPGFDNLHFELCYHRPIELCISMGWTRFEAGAQGQHKLKRGLMPALTFSSHWLRHAGLSDAVARAMKQEDEAVRRQVVTLAEHGPFRREEC